MIDAHVHTWPTWPYRQSRLDEVDDASGPRLIQHLDEGGLDGCWLIAAELPRGDGIGHIPDNAYAESIRVANPTRIRLFIDVDSRWSPSHHLPGAVGRLRNLLALFPAACGVSHYLGPGDDGWLRSDEGERWLNELARRRLVLSLAAGPAWYRSIVDAARGVPELPIVLHHLAGVTRIGDLTRVSVLADTPNVHVKVSGGHYLRAEPDSGFDVSTVTSRLRSELGAGRLVWGSDFPVDGRFLSSDGSREMTSRALAVFSEAERARVMHDNAVLLTNGAG